MSAFQQRPPFRDPERDIGLRPEDGRLLSEKIASEIRSAVLSGEMRPGMRIRQELLAAHFRREPHSSSRGAEATGK